MGGSKCFKVRASGFLAWFRRTAGHFRRWNTLVRRLRALGDALHLEYQVEVFFVAGELLPKFGFNQLLR
jgi:hypothetical protein